MALELSAAASSSSLSSSGEDTSDDDKEVEQHPANNPPAPASAVQESEESDGEDDDEEESDKVGSSNELGENGVPIKSQPSPPPLPQGVERSESDDDDEEADQRTTKKLPSPAMASQESDGSDADDEEDGGDSVGPSGEIGDKWVLTKRSPQPPPLPQVREGFDDAEVEEDSGSLFDVPPSPVPTPQPKGNVPSPDLAEMSQLNRKAAATEHAESPEPKKKPPPAELAKSPSPKKAAAAVAARLAKSPSPKKAAAAATTVVPKSPEAAASAGAAEHQLQEVEYDAEQHLEEKKDLCWYLWMEVLAVEAKYPGMLFRGAFLKMGDDKASKLNTKIKRQSVAEINLQLRSRDIQKEVAKVLANLI